ncbi:carbamoyl-phosphate synthase small subunit [Psychromonas sp. CNPT3]|uniref:glutamine-hydrolyzing carbamoyl-phosphate synthase small subunit n=1 Tax=Psychromonas sp. CNPT3 TaxID=314282 RepID=UPI00006E8098|nr:glutamine-hydrolyzing carbamoyl-phosphate synthase small subunit [Psychromonas sp. CNPT3]AGH80768.1 carbamoyl-phosphate synthase small subunit [Psychromonas sp. CNPT3]
MSHSAVLILEDGTVFKGVAIGAEGYCVGEVVFNTSMTGYQEILTDPSYSRQIVTLTYPHVGNTGINDEDQESEAIHACGLVIRDLPLLVSNFRSQMCLSTYLKQHNIVAIAEIDTRKLTRLLALKGALSGCIVAGDDIDVEAALKKAQQFPGLKGMDLAQHVSTKESYQWRQGSWTLTQGLPEDSTDSLYHVVAFDYGVKRNILRMLVDRGCSVTVVPAKTSASAVLALAPDGIFLSNGPGDPAPCDYAIDAISELLKTNIPIFGICLGHQLLALASGAKTVKMKFGHHGANHPVQDLKTKKVMITSQNHGFAVDEKSLPDNMCATHISLFDGSLQGIMRTDKPAFSFQGHPEASPGPNDAGPLFNHFITLIQQYKKQQ